MKRREITDQELIIGYAIARLDSEYLQLRNLSSLSDAYREAEQFFGRSRNSFSNLRDEFDPFLSNDRKGWHGRKPHPNRVAIASALEDSSNKQVADLVQAIFESKTAVVAEEESPANNSSSSAAVAARLETGRKAESFFMEHCSDILGIPTEELIDLRNAACGFDFGWSKDDQLAIEVKGVVSDRGSLLFTDKEWKMAEERGDKYVLVVVLNLSEKAEFRVLRNPRATLTAECVVQMVQTTAWRSAI